MQTRTFHFLARHLSRLALVALAACARPSPAVPTPTSAWLPTATPAPTATSVPPSATPQPSPTPSPTATSAPTSTPQPTATPDYVRVPEYAGPGLKRDRAGRVLGGSLPIVNYSPTMVTGKACPRVTKWTVEVLPFEGFNRALLSDPCVAQNAIDDYVEIAWALPYHADYGVMEDVTKRYRTAPELQGRIADFWIKTFAEGNAYRTGFAYQRCSPDAVAVIDQSGRPIVDSRTGTVMELEILRTSIGLAPRSCDILSYDTGKPRSQFQETQAVLREKGVSMLKVRMFWEAEQKRWVYGGPVDLGYKSYTAAREMYARTGLKQ